MHGTDVSCSSCEIQKPLISILGLIVSILGNKTTHIQYIFFPAVLLTDISLFYWFVAFWIIFQSQENYSQIFFLTNFPFPLSLLFISLPLQPASRSWIYNKKCFKAAFLLIIGSTKKNQYFCPLLRLGRRRGEERNTREHSEQIFQPM